jgi:hypothetical protein
MIWDTWISDPEILALEQMLTSLGTVVMKMDDHVRIGAFSRTRIFDAETFKRKAAEIGRTRGGGNPDPRGQRTRGRSSRNRGASPDGGVTQADVEIAADALSQLMLDILAERDAWRVRAMEAEGKLSIANRPATRPPNVDIDKIKRLLARELHPDAASNEDEKKLRSTLFQQIWPLVERLEGALPR